MPDPKSSKEPKLGFDQLSCSWLVEAKGGVTHSALVVMDGSLQEANPPEKSCMPMITKTTCSVRTQPKTLPTAGIALKSVVMISRMPALRETRRSGRRTRITRSTRKGRSSSTDSASSTRSEMQTIAKSTWFHALLMYLMKPSAHTLMSISHTKKPVKQRSSNRSV
eukprot:5530066-Prymnesium_polylepis.2